MVHITSTHRTDISLNSIFLAFFSGKYDEVRDLWWRSSYLDSYEEIHWYLRYKGVNVFKEEATVWVWLFKLCSGGGKGDKETTAHECQDQVSSGSSFKLTSSHSIWSHPHCEPSLNVPQWLNIKWLTLHLSLRSSVKYTFVCMKDARFCVLL